ncbi:hypothetical protein [Niveibacterium sp.]|uniref:hypothetical protein n=1 Tax=Niveibacterium sp. TaxID=2017444 RepID=UPI0035B2D878
MTKSRLITAAILIALSIWGSIALRSPYRAQLPVGSTDLSAIQAKLDKLPKNERALVYGYVKRSRGDVLPPQFADPDEPLTARNVGEAIALQRKFLVRMAEQEKKMEARRAERDAALAPLREAVSIDLVRREILPASEAQRDPGERGSVKHAQANEHDVLVTTYRLENLTNQTIRVLEATVNLRKLHPREDELGIADHCYFNRSEPLEPGAPVEVRCADLRKGVSEDDRDFVAMPGSELLIDWEPKRIRFGDGSELEYQN